MNIGRKIVILGCPGSGKSTLARRLHERTGLLVHHLDNLWWKADRTHISRDEFDRELQRLIHGNEWIIDGDYSRTYEMRIAACDTVILLDYGEAVCMAGINERIGRERPDMPWVEERPDPELAALVRHYRRDKVPIIGRLMEKYPEKAFVILKTRAQTEQWLSQIQTKGERHEADEL